MRRLLVTCTKRSETEVVEELRLTHAAPCDIFLSSVENVTRRGSGVEVEQHVEDYQDQFEF